MLYMCVKRLMELSCYMWPFLILLSCWYFFFLSIHILLRVFWFVGKMKKRKKNKMQQRKAGRKEKKCDFFMKKKCCFLPPPRHAYTWILLTYILVYRRDPIFLFRIVWFLFFLLSHSSCYHFDYSTSWIDCASGARCRAKTYTAQHSTDTHK